MLKTIDYRQDISEPTTVPTLTRKPENEYLADFTARGLNLPVETRAKIITDTIEPFFPSDLSRRREFVSKLVASILDAAGIGASPSELPSVAPPPGFSTSEDIDLEDWTRSESSGIIDRSRAVFMASRAAGKHSESEDL